jgi:CRISPR/Cas system-associated exonuclease Cas4 (RecB family)
MEKIPTAEEFFDSSNLRVSYDTEYQYCKRAVMEKAIEFAKLHVEAALKAASKCQIDSDIYMMTEYGESMDWETSILNSYPLENIK